MAKEKLTQGRVSAFSCQPDESAAFLWDTVTQGFGLKASQGGRKTFVFQTKLNGKDLRVTIGTVSAWTLDKARQEANRLQTLTDQGTDPREQKRERIAAAEAKKLEQRRRDVTVSEAWSAYVEARRGKWSARHLSDHEEFARGGDIQRKRGTGTLKAGPLAALMPHRLNDLTAAKVATWLDNETQTRPTKAALAYRLLRAFLRWSAGHDDYKASVDLDAVGSRIAKDHVPRARAKQDDCLQREQLAAWFAAVKKITPPAVSAYLQGLILTGARREELASLKWADVDFQWKSLKIADKVEESGRIIPLTPFVAALLTSLPRRNEWVFSSAARNSKTGRIAAVWQPHEDALQVAGLPHVSLHGLRRSFGTLAEWTEAPVGVVAQIMGHKPSAIAEKHYRRRPLDLLRMWHVRIEAWILEQAGIEQPKEEQVGLRLVETA
ncbi:MAG: integrase family protein [Betaproteobacteria bacterium]|nr:integrase family protein [Betaproteobacteria bacterium]